jgi:hypothetical protein
MYNNQLIDIAKAQLPFPAKDWPLAMSDANEEDVYNKHRSIRP